MVRIGLTAGRGLTQKRGLTQNVGWLAAVMACGIYGWAVEPKPPPAAARVMQEAMAALQAGLDKVVDRETPAQKKAAYSGLIKKLNGGLKRRNITFRLPIKSVTAPPNGDVVLEVDAVEGAAEVEAVSGKLAVLYWQPPSRQEGLQVKPGDICELSGTPRVGISEPGTSSKCVEILRVGQDGLGTQPWEHPHAFYLDRQTVRVVPGEADETTEGLKAKGIGIH